MERQRLKDGLVGAAVGALVLVLVLVVFVWWISEPVGSDGPAAAGPTAPSTDTPPAAVTTPPTDLATGEMWLTDLALDAGTIATPDGVIHDVVAVGTDVRTGPAGMVAGSMSVDATVPFGLVAAQVGQDVTVTQGERGMVSVVRVFELGGRELRVVASGTVEVVEGRLVIEPQTIDVGGPRFLAALAGRIARELVTIEHTIEGLPEGLVLLDVSVQEDGFRAALSGDDVRIAPGDVGLVP